MLKVPDIWVLLNNRFKPVEGTLCGFSTPKLSGNIDGFFVPKLRHWEWKARVLMAFRIALYNGSILTKNARMKEDGACHLANEI